MTEKTGFIDTQGFVAGEEMDTTGGLITGCGDGARMATEE